MTTDSKTQYLGSFLVVVALNNFLEVKSTSLNSKKDAFLTGKQTKFAKNVSKTKESGFGYWFLAYAS